MQEIEFALRRSAIFLVKLYRNYLSHLKLRSCIFHPTCSEFALEAIGRHGFFDGCWMTARRLLRCHPFSRPGFDPVP